MTSGRFKQLQKQESTVAPADNALRRKIGSSVAMGDIFTLEKIEQCQKLVDQSMADCLEEIKIQVSTLGEQYKMAAEQPETATAALHSGKELSASIKKRMETLNFIFGYKVAESLHNYIHSKASFTPDMLLVICKHVAVMHLIIQQRITDDGGALGKEMLANLKTLIKKQKTISDPE